MYVCVCVCSHVLFFRRFNGKWLYGIRWEVTYLQKERITYGWLKVGTVFVNDIPPDQACSLSQTVMVQSMGQPGPMPWPGYSPNITLSKVSAQMMRQSTYQAAHFTTAVPFVPRQAFASAGSRPSSSTPTAKTYNVGSASTTVQAQGHKPEGPEPKATNKSEVSGATNLKSDNSGGNSTCADDGCAKKADEGSDSEAAFKRSSLETMVGWWYDWTFIRSEHMSCTWHLPNTGSDCVQHALFLESWASHPVIHLQVRQYSSCYSLGDIQPAIHKIIAYSFWSLPCYCSVMSVHRKLAPVPLQLANAQVPD